MKVYELIEILNSINDKSIEVVFPGYEGSFNSVSKVELVELYLNVNKEYYYGPHELVDFYTKSRPKHKIAKAVKIN